ncbi:MAG: 1-acyl-sn-glycerol-3-phosphate acyltransferase [Spirochaetaceae bacterium]|nr:MAG: 1-acyl-sn-glycerol-3-phosphate acyltransferase [Spirochaetaceae bacterium]
MAKKRDKLRESRPVGRLFYIFASLYLRPPLFRFFKLIPQNTAIIPTRGAGILVASHVNFFDPIWIYDVLERPIYFMATEELFRGTILSFVVRLFGAFPIRKKAGDFQSVKNMFTVIKAGGLIGIYPEGVRTWDGTNAPLIPTIARIIRLTKVPVYSCRIEGGYLHFPRWADKWRPIRPRLIFEQLYTPDTIPATDEQILSEIAAAIRIRDYELPIDASTERVAGLAAGIDRLIYRCPSCQSLETLEAVEPLSTNLVECRSCFACWKVDLGSRLTEVDEDERAVGEAQTAAAVYRRIRSFPLKPIAASPLSLQEGEKLFLASRPHFLYREKQFPDLRLIGFGRAFLTDRRFIFHGRLERMGRMSLVVPLEQIDSLSVEPGNKLHFMYRGHLYRIPIRNESALKWYDYLQQLVEKRKAGK